MPTFPGCWAPCSGSLEDGESPLQAAIRELGEETNALDECLLDGDDDDHDDNDDRSKRRRSMSSTVSPYGLYVDVPFPRRSKSVGATAAAAVAPAVDGADDDDDDDTTTSHRQDGSSSCSIIRVYPFAVHVPPSFHLEMRGTEHDLYRWVTVPELERLKPAVPGLALAFHHATRGKYCPCFLPHGGDRDEDKDAAGEGLARAAREWASDQSSGAAVMARNALKLLLRLDFNGSSRQRDDAMALASLMIVMRPAMVAITHALWKFQALANEQILSPPPTDSGSGLSFSSVHPAQQVLDELDRESHRSVEAAAEATRRALRFRRAEGSSAGSDAAPPADDADSDASRASPVHVVVFSRSSTLVSVLRVLDSSEHALFRVTCSRSTPGDEGELMARDVESALGTRRRSEIESCSSNGKGGSLIRVEDDATLLDPAWWLENPVHLVLVGTDCVLSHQAYNKVGTRALAEAAQAAKVPVICCGDSFKTWDDAFPPPLEGIFEAVPRELFSEVIV
jgi:translation initiation factor 2B subunit (eIF-2B alpha/beta/delta family)/8-oxo-dGTP pyrophosphatase MutT (NUDIX family)